jgi:putative transposase
MLDAAVHRHLPLSKGWPSRIRSSTVQAISAAHFSLTFARGVAANSINKRMRLQADVDRLRQEAALLHEELRIKDARMLRIPAQRRPHYPPTERLAVLELRAARARSIAETARRLLVTPLTVTSWMSRLDDEGPDALVRLPERVNRFPEFVGYLVRRLKTLCPTMGTRKIAQVLCRAGLHLGATTVRRMLAQSKRCPSRPIGNAALHVVRATRRNEVWHADLTTVPIIGRFWVPWLPWALPQRWPFCWWVAIVVDHYSRRMMGVAVFRSRPTSAAVRAFLDRVIRVAGTAPRYLITDRGVQFIAAAFLRWCRRRRIGQRFGAVGKYGSIAVVERVIRTMKTECTRRILVPLGLTAIQRELSIFASWYNGERAHDTLGARTPDEMYFGLRPACRMPRFEPRPRWPRRSPCAGPCALIRGRPGVVVELDVSRSCGRKHLPVIGLRRAA